VCAHGRQAPVKLLADLGDLLGLGCQRLLTPHARHDLGKREHVDGRSDNDAILERSLESQVLTQAKRFEALKVETGGKPIEAMPLVEATPRVLTKLSSNDDLPAAAE